MPKQLGLVAETGKVRIQEKRMTRRCGEFVSLAQHNLSCSQYTAFRFSLYPLVKLSEVWDREIKDRVLVGRCAA